MRKGPWQNTRTGPLAGPADRTNRRIRLWSLAAFLTLLLAAGAYVAALGLSSSLLAFAYPAYAMLEQAEAALPPAGETPAVKEQALEIQAETEHAAPDGAGQEGAALPVMGTGGSGEPRILIYHTHATEAYLLTEDDPYEPSGDWRTKDQTKNVVAVGARLKELLETEYGLSVLHDVSNYEPPKLSTAYSRSLTAMEQYKKTYPSIDIFIDVHRDAYGSGTDAPKDYVELNGAQTARLMFVVGTGEGATGAGFDEMPDFESNRDLAERISAYLRKTDQRLVRDVRVKTGRYNQHVSDRCLLVEVGHNANTLSQAMNAVPHLAEAVAACIDDLSKLAGQAVWAPQ